ncbi:MAG: protein kinase [Parachlamydiales bacterium]
MTVEDIRWSPALSNEQIGKDQRLPLFEKWWKEEQLENIRTFLQSEVLDYAAQQCKLFASASEAEKASLFFPLKEKLNQAIDLLQIFFETGKKIKPALADESAIQMLLKECLGQIKPLYIQIDASLSQIEAQFSFSLNEKEIESIVQQLHKKLNQPKPGVPPIQQNLIDQTCAKLQLSLQYLTQHFPAIRKTLFTVGRNLIYFSTPACPYPFAITTCKKIYLILFDSLNNIETGSIKKVFRCINLISQQWIAAIKAITYFPEIASDRQGAFRINTFQRLYFEASVFKMLQGQLGIMQLYDIMPFQVSSFPEIFLFEELFEFGDLSKFINIAIYRRDRACCFSNAQQNQIVLKLLKILVTIHRSKIVHRSIKAANFLLKFDWDPKHIRIAITDFEDCCFLDDLERRKSMRSLAIIHSPEYAKMTLNKQRTDEEIIRCNSTPYDVWGMGIILYQFCLLKYPSWFLITQEDPTPFIANLEPGWANKETADHPLAPLILGMLEVDPAKRLTAEQSLELAERIFKSQTI